VGALMAISVAAMVLWPAMFNQAPDCLKFEGFQTLCSGLLPDERWAVNSFREFNVRQVKGEGFRFHFLQRCDELHLVSAWSNIKMAEPSRRIERT
jgi:hypothetical protein